MAMRWRILCLLFLVRVGLGFQFQTLGSVGDDLIKEFSLDYAAVGTLVGLFMLPGLFLALPVGFSGRFASDRLLTGLGVLALAVGGLVSGLSDSAWVIGAGRLIAGAGFVFANIYLTKMTADWFAGKEIATAMSILVMSWPFGIAMGQIGHEWLAAATTWRWPFFVASAYCGVGALATLAFYRAPESDLPSGVRPVSRLSGKEWRLVVYAAVAWGVFNAGYIVYLSFGPPVLEAQGRSAVQAATVISIGSWIMIFSGALCGQIVDRTGRPGIVMIVCIVAGAIAMGLLAIDGAGLAASILFGLLGMAPAGVIMALSGEAMRPERRAFGMGVFFTIYYVIMFAGPPIAGWIFDNTGQPFAPMLFGILLFASVIPAYGLFRLAKRR